MTYSFRIAFVCLLLICVIGFCNSHCLLIFFRDDGDDLPSFAVSRVSAFDFLICVCVCIHIKKLYYYNYKFLSQIELASQIAKC